LLLPVICSYSQQITNIHFEQVAKQIHIYYDLSGDGAYTIQVFCSTDNGQSWGKPLQKVSGAVGQNQKAGNGKMIVWDVLKEREKLMGNILFKVSASQGAKIKMVFVKDDWPNDLPLMDDAVVENSDNLEDDRFSGLPLMDDGANIKMVFVKGGTFQMGCTSEQSDCDDDEKPVHTVTVGDFYMGKYEVTQKQWRDVMGSNPSWFSGCDDCPVESVSWNEVKEFIKKLNEKTGQHYRLPTEAEWEYAARGGSLSPAGGGAGGGKKFAGSNDIDKVAWYWKNTGDKYLTGSWNIDNIYNNNCRTHPVGQKNPNELGLYDMSGNVWEWCSDWYANDYYGSSPRNNPQGPSSGSGRVYRGGSWSSLAWRCRVADRGSSTPGGSGINLGFRLVLIP
ncbi:MAG: formylglycine-generating enzyme family protein, partial [Bacteroidales bacterium]|nr:formylglycine-generating enzyme family protein [Bacteroidales bacterium]